MSKQSCSAENRVFEEGRVVDFGNRTKDSLQSWKIILKVKFSNLIRNFNNDKKAKIFHIWIIAILMALGTLTYYAYRINLVSIVPLNHLNNAPHDFLRSIFLIPITYAAIIFRVRGSLVVSCAFLCIVLPRALWDSPYPDALFRGMVFVIIASAISLVIAVGMNRIDKKEENTKLYQFLANCVSERESEKQHLAREIHDGSLQVLMDISHDIDTLSEAEIDEDARVGLKLLRDKADSVQTGLRQMVTGLRPPLLKELGLESSLRWLANEIVEKQGIEVTVEIIGKTRRLLDSVELALFRIAQEALQNAKKHSQATAILIKLAYNRGKIEMIIKDNGTGFSVPIQDQLAVSKKFGLIGMAERARLTGGTLRIESSLGKGTTISVNIAVNNLEQSLTKDS